MLNLLDGAPLATLQRQSAAVGGGPHSTHERLAHGVTIGVEEEGQDAAVLVAHGGLALVVERAVRV